MKPEGWTSEPDGSSTWAALESSYVNLAATLCKGASPPAIARARERAAAAHQRAAALTRILEDTDAEATTLRQAGALTSSQSADEVRQFLLQGLKPLVKRLRSRLLGRRSWTFRNWITNSLRVGGGALHRHTRLLGQPMQELSTEFDEGGNLILGALAQNDAKTERWAELWQASRSPAPAADWWPELLRRAREVDLPDFDITDLKQVLRRFRSHRYGRGSTEPPLVAPAAR
jgi:hypothetical protein